MANKSGNIPPQEEASAEPTSMLSRTYEQLFGRFNLAPQTGSWPKLVGLTAEEAEKKIKEDMAGAEVIVVELGPLGCSISMDFRPKRVRIYVDSTGKVQCTPTTG